MNLIWIGLRLRLRLITSLVVNKTRINKSVCKYKSEWNVPDLTLQFHLDQFKVFQSQVPKVWSGSIYINLLLILTASTFVSCIFGKLAGVVGFFKPLSSHRVTYLCIDASIQSCDSVTRSSKGPGTGGSCKLVRLPFWFGINPGFRCLIRSSFGSLRSC